jgi:hypoxanthine phosphoribosyltransferase
MEYIKVHEKHFQSYLSENSIRKRVVELGEKITTDFQGKELFVVGVLSGAFIFLADLCREISIPIEISFIGISSYEGIESKGVIKRTIALNANLKGKNVLIVEDIVDTGSSMNHLISEILSYQPAHIFTASLLFKPDAFRFNYTLDYVGFEIPNKFVLGYGLDYNGLGRNLPSIYQLKIS